MSMVYMTQTISTIVDEFCDTSLEIRLYDPNNFYYCRFTIYYIKKLRLYDPNNFYYCRWNRGLFIIEKCLYDPNNFYYCRYEGEERSE